MTKVEKMPDEWFVRTSQGELGPWSTEELLEHANSAQIQASDRVRKGMGVWMPAKNVSALAGVFQPAQKSRPEVMASHSQPSPRQASISKPRQPGFLRKGVSSRMLFWCGGTFVILAVAAISGWLSLADPTFPKPVSIPVEAQSPQRVAAHANALLPPRPVVPSIPGLKKGVAHPVPGLEKFTTAYSPTLTDDLYTIVFAKLGNPGTKYDLYLSNRTSLSAPFETPMLIRSCVSPETEAYPSISPDGLELLFVRSDSQPVILYARRDSRAAEFSEPVEWEVSQQHAADYRQGSPQFLGSSSMMFSRLKKSAADRELLTVTRSEGSMGFTDPQVLPFVDRSCLYALARNQLRAYFGRNEGISFVVRSSVNRSFASSRLLITADLTGPVDGPVWVAPKEDLILFCSPGVGQPPLSSRRLWMVQF